jgi:hypothetical protein
MGESTVGRSSRWDALAPVSRSSYALVVAATALALTVCAGSLVLGRSAHAGVISAANSRSDSTHQPDPAQGVSFAGRVVELETGKPVAGASVVIKRFVWGGDDQSKPPWAGESTIETDADGRFRLTFPPEQVADDRLSITLRVSHAGFVPRTSWGTTLVNLTRTLALGDKPFFETVTLEKGVEYTGLVVLPGGKPATGVACWFENWTRTEIQSAGFNDDTHCQTDIDGRFRLRMPRSHGIALYLSSAEPSRARFPYAPYQHFYGTADPGEHPDVWAPTDLGRIELKRGVRLAGRLLDLAGRPIAGQTIKAFPARGRDQHTATTDDDGSFALGPLRHANYVISGEGQDAYGSVDTTAPALRPSVRVFKPVKVYLKEDVAPAPLVIHESPTVRVEVQFVDSQGRPGGRADAKVWGIIPNGAGVANGFAARRSFGSGLASDMNDPEPEDTSERIDWSMQDRPGADGRIVFRVPEGLQEARLNAYPIDGTTAFKTRLEENKPLKYWGGGELGTLDADRKITIVCFRGATVVVTVKAEDHTLFDKNLIVSAKFDVNFGSYAHRFAHHADGRYRSSTLMPEHEYQIVAASREYVPLTIPRVNLPEGGFAELTIPVRKRPKPSEAGKPAPAFSVRTLDGTLLTKDSLRGRFVLLHFWQPNPQYNGLDDLASLKAVADRFGKDNRFAMIGLCQVNDPAVALRIIKDSGLSWANVVLRDLALDPMAVDYFSSPTPKSFLIGPDGTLIARDLKGIVVEKAVSAALGAK